MRHVDEGTIHAWLDGQITDPAEGAWIEEHLRWCAACGARMAEERATLEQANALLAVAAPVAEPPPFEALAAKAGNSPHASDAMDAARGRRWLLQLGWAASLAMAVGIGWMVRDMTGREAASSRLAATDRAVDNVSRPASTPAPAPGIVGPPSAGQSRNAAATAPVEQRQAAAPSPAPVPAATRREPPAAPTPPPAANATASAREAEVQFEATRRQLQQLASGASAPARQMAAPSAPPSAAPMAPAMVTERITATSAGRTRLAVAQRAEWQPLARTEAAARSGMALYGIDGLTPILTAISTDERVVLTLYRLESGATLEMEQQREAAGTAPVQPAPAARAGSAVQGRAEIVGDVAAPAPDARVWSGVRGDVRITMRTPSVAADLEALGLRLRVD